MVELRKEDYTEEEKAKIKQNTEVPGGAYSASLRDIVEKDTAFGPAYMFTFIIHGGGHDGKIINGFTPTKWKPGNKLDKWLKAFGVDAGINERFNTDMIKGTNVQLFVGPNKNGKLGILQIAEDQGATVPKTQVPPAVKNSASDSSKQAPQSKQLDSGADDDDVPF